MELIKTLQLETLTEDYPGRLSAPEIIEDLSVSLNPERYSVSGSELHKVCVYFAEQAVEPVGWQALWRCDSKTRPSLNRKLNSPSLVEVLNVDYDSLEATVEVVDSDERCQHSVLLIELYPLKHQENNAINIEATHAALQRIRFLHNHLSFPWDSDIIENWFEIHLPVRVKMYCELRTNSLSQEIIVRFHFLVSEAHRVQQELQLMASKVPDSDDEMDIEESVVGTIADLNTKLEQIQQDVEILLNPSTRMLLFGKKVTRVKENDQPEVLLVIQSETCSKLHQILCQVQSEISPDQNIKGYPSLQTALDDIRTNDTILIPSGIHYLENINALRHGGMLIGIGSKEDVVVHLGCNSEVGLTFEAGLVTFKNCTILVNNKQSGISVKGKLLLENCFLKGPPPLPDADKVDENASAWKGIYIASHSQVTMKQCTVANFDVGLRVRGTGHLTISSSLIEMCNIGLLAEQSATVKIDNSELQFCQENAIVVEMDVDDEEATTSGDIELLEILSPTFSIGQSNFLGNACNVKLEF